MYKKIWDILKTEIEKGVKAYDEEVSKTDESDKIKCAWLKSGRSTLVEVRSFMDMIQIEEHISERFFDNNGLHVEQNRAASISDN